MFHFFNKWLHWLSCEDRYLVLSLQNNNRKQNIIPIQLLSRPQPQESRVSVKWQTEFQSFPSIVNKTSHITALLHDSFLIYTIFWWTTFENCPSFQNFIHFGRMTDLKVEACLMALVLAFSSIVDHSIHTIH